MLRTFLPGPPQFVFFAAGSTTIFSPLICLDGFSHHVEVRWRSPNAGSGIEGHASVLVEGRPVTVFRREDTTEWLIDDADLGTPGQVSAEMSGFLDFDDFESHAQLPTGEEPLFVDGFDCGDIGGWAESFP